MVDEKLDIKKEKMNLVKLNSAIAMEKVTKAKEQIGIGGKYSGSYLHYENIGDVISYRITVTNESEVEATNVVVTDDVPAGTEYVSDSATDNAVLYDRTLVWNIVH